MDDTPVADSSAFEIQFDAFDPTSDSASHVEERDGAESAEVSASVDRSTGDAGGDDSSGPMSDAESFAVDLPVENDESSADESNGEGLGDSVEVEFAEAAPSSGFEISFESAETLPDDLIQFDSAADDAPVFAEASPSLDGEFDAEASSVEFEALEEEAADASQGEDWNATHQAERPIAAGVASASTTASAAAALDALDRDLEGATATADADDPPAPPPEPVSIATEFTTAAGQDTRSGIFGGLASAVLHVWIILTLAGLSHSATRAVVDEPLDMAVFETAKQPDFEEEAPVMRFELANPGDRETEVRQAMNTTSVGRERGDKFSVASAPEPDLRIDLPLRGAKPSDISIGAEVDERVVVKGTVGDGLVQLDAALDRVTWEIAQNLQEKKVLVVWMLDASASLEKQRVAIAKRLKRIYGEIGALEDIGELSKQEQPLLTGVVSYGQSYEYLTREPTDKFDSVVEAFQKLKPDESGVENVFAAVGSVVKHWQKYRTAGRRIMLIVVTDETGDDFGKPMEEAISLCRRFGAKAYCIGPSAVFGRRKGYVPYVAPENKRTYQLPVDLGPETAMLENVRLPFWYDGPQFEYLTSGFGPYALSRLVNETSGVYFMTSMTTMAGLSPLGEFDGELLKPFAPEYRFGSVQEYEADLKKHPLRYATVMAAQASEAMQPPGTPDLDIKVTPANFRQQATNAQQKAAEIQLALDSILQAFPQGIEKELAKEASPRWRVTFCLSYGRLLAQKTRCLEYNTALANLKGNLTPEDVGKKSNHWIFQPDTEVNYATTMRRSAKLAEELLRQVVDEAPGTPWAILASRELAQPFGLSVVEKFIPPPPPPPPARPAPPGPRPVALARERPRPTPAAPTKPAPPPKLPRL